MLKTKLMSALVLTVVGATAQAAIPDSLTFDGYCDGITGITDNGDGTFTGTHAYGLCGGYTDTAMAGPVGNKLGGASGFGVAAGDSSYPQFGASFTYSVSSDGTWTLIAPEFGGLINSGTWSPGYDASKIRGTRPSFTK